MWGAERASSQCATLEVSGCEPKAIVCAHTRRGSAPRQCEEG